ncbi:hypothetical protein [Corynebacterium phocae]|uniref:hypothetical protein n=1 Tax=Corynebacterium phocae TaxID=161895 RepID=UPI000953373D|nr:hypothetical protein [Corynebacterium phocae]KAA8722496.1 hypothetical protein F4V58_08550 [Corynebacterium phocae]
MASSFTLRTRVVSAAIASALVLSSPAAVLAAPAPVTGVETHVSTDSLVAVPARVNFADAETIGLPALKKIRSEMWDINPPWDHMPLREAAGHEGLDTKEKYVNAVAIDPELTKLAVQRSAEFIPAGGHRYGGLVHTRPFIECSAACLPPSDIPSSENLALAKNDFGNAMYDAIYHQWGHRELKNLQRRDGAFALDSGHLYNLLDPTRRWYGFGSPMVYIDGKWYGSSAAVATSFPLGNSVLEDKEIRDNLYRSALKGETPTGIIAYTEPPEPSEDDHYQEDRGSSASNVIGIIVGIISLLAVVAKVVSPYMHRFGF